MSEDKKQPETLVDEEMVTSPKLSRRLLLAGAGMALAATTLGGRKALASDDEKDDADKGDDEKDDADKGDDEKDEEMDDEKDDADDEKDDEKDEEKDESEDERDSD